MTIVEYIKCKIEKFGIFQISEADIIDICEANSFTSDDDMDKYTLKQRETAIVRYAPELLLSLDSISENGFSVSRSNTETRIRAYISSKCKELGIEDLLTQKSIISSGTKRW